MTRLFNMNSPSHRYLYAGDVIVSPEPLEVISVLGSCVSVCLYDKKHGMGGINHFKAPIFPGGRAIRNGRYGDVAMEELLTGMKELGSTVRSLRAMVVGGGEVIAKMSKFYNVGRENLTVAFDFLQKHGIKVVFEDTSGPSGRRIHFNTGTGELSVTLVNGLENSTLLMDRRNREEMTAARRGKD